MPMSEQGGRAYRQIVSYLASTPWVLLPATFEVMCEVIALRLEGSPLSAEEIEERIQAGPGPGGGRYRDGTVAVIPLYGMLVPKASLMTAVSGGTSLTGFGAALAAAAEDPDVSAILIDVDSPGGSVDLVPETAARIRAARDRKPVVAIANTQAASGAYWLASQADELVMSPSARVGSIGVLSMHEDRSGLNAALGLNRTLITAGKYKGELSPDAPLSEEARAGVQALVDEIYSTFVNEVAKGRGVSAADVRSGFGQGRMVNARTAVAEGMADRIEAIDQTVARIARRPPRRRTSAAALDDTDLAAIEPPEDAPEPSPAAGANNSQTTHDDHDPQTLAAIRDRLVATTAALKEA